jgi:predicted nuclease of restriction endonuclease-like RecB superfamily
MRTSRSCSAAHWGSGSKCSVSAACFGPAQESERPFTTSPPRARWTRTARIANGGDLLPHPFLRYYPDGDAARPAWLEPRHDAWLRTALEAFDASAGLPTIQLDARVHSLSTEAGRNGLAEPVARGVWHVLRRWSRTVVDAPVPPRRLREEMFLLAATAPSEEVMQTFCRRLNADTARVKSWLYAELPGARVLRIKPLPIAEGLRDAYNLALAQGLVGRCSRIEVRVEENVRVVVRAAKLRGLLVSVDADGPSSGRPVRSPCFGKRRSMRTRSECSSHP